jgi:hypothetical protein
MKVAKKNKKKNRILPYSWLPAGTYHTDLAIRKKNLQNLANLVLFFCKKAFV